MRLHLAKPRPHIGPFYITSSRKRRPVGSGCLAWSAAILLYVFFLALVGAALLVFELAKFVVRKLRNRG